MNEIFFTIIIYVDKDDMLENCLNSILDVTDDITAITRIIVVDPICSGVSAGICKRMEEKCRAGNFIYISLPGVSIGKAYNEAIPTIKGRYVNFLMSSLCFQPSVLKAIYECAVRLERPKIISLAPWTVNENGEEVPYKLSPTSKELIYEKINLEREPVRLQLFLAACFIRCYIVTGQNRRMFFKPELLNDAPVEFLLNIFKEYQHYVFLPNEKLYYTFQLEDNTSAFFGRHQLWWYIDSFKNWILPFEKRCREDNWPMNMSVQTALLWLIASRFLCNDNNRNKGVLSGETLDEVCGLAGEALQYIENRIIVEEESEQTFSIPRTLRIYLSQLKTDCAGYHSEAVRYQDENHFLTRSEQTGSVLSSSGSAPNLFYHSDTLQEQNRETSYIDNVKVSVIGSIHTRDIFSENIIPICKKYFTLCDYFRMVSMPSIMGEKAVPYNFQKLVDSCISRVQKEHWFYELEKPVLTILENNAPDYLLMDFYMDAMYGIRMYHGEYLVNKLSRLKGENIIKWDDLSTEYSYEKNTEEFMTIWKDAMDRFMEFMKKKLPNTTIIINTVKGTNLVTNHQNGTELLNPKLQNLDVEKVNTIWSLMDAYMIDRHNVKAITYEKNYTLDPEYIHGLGAELVHFHRDYHDDFFNKLVLLTEENVPETVPLEDVSRPNLFLKSSFDYGTNTCSHQTGKFQIISYDDYDAITPIDCGQDLGKYWPQMWSKPLEVDGDGSMQYRLSFSLKIEDPRKVSGETVVFAIRVFNNIEDLEREFSKQEFALNLKGYEIVENEVYLCMYDFCPKGKYVKAGPFLFKYIPGIEYGHMKLERID